MGEKDRMRGFGSPSICSEVRTPSPQPSPLRGEGVPCASFAVFSSPNAPVLAAHLGARVFSARDRERIARQQKTVMSNAEPVRGKERAGGVAAFRSFVTRAALDLSKKSKEAERRQTRGTNRCTLRCGARPFGARTLVGVPP